MIEAELFQEQNVSMTEKQVVECELVQRLFSALHLEGFTFKASDRPDVVATGNGRRIGIEMTVFHGDEGQNLHGGSAQRKTEEQINRNVADRPDAMPVVVDPLPALVARIKDKVKKARDYQAESFDELWLVIDASVPRLGAVASTHIVSIAVNQEILNNSSHDLLSGSSYAKVYLHLLMGGGLYEWTRADSWCVLQAPQGISGVSLNRIKEILSDPEWRRDPVGKGHAEAMKALEELRAMKQNQVG